MANSHSETGNQRPAFEIGLVMAGAISAGAYTAGVIDFLLEALDQWYAHWNDRPPHDVRIRVMSGASAGGMTAAIAAAALGGELVPMRRPPEAMSENPLYRSWVQRIDITKLLGTRDLDRGGKLRSALDCTELDAIAGEAIRVTPTRRRRPYVANPLEVFLSVANLRGIPYTIPLAGGTPGVPGHRMSAHADYMHFAIGTQIPGAVALDPDDYAKAEWHMLAKTALATGAFPLGLAPRMLTRPTDDYRTRSWWVANLQDGGVTYLPHAVMPDWNPPAGYTYEFLCVDGGMMDNEPLELARRTLAGEGRNARDPYAASRAVILIDPFPDGPTFTPEYEAPQAVPAVLLAMFNSLVLQSRFKPEELVLAAKEDVRSRFLIAPARSHPPGRTLRSAIACGALGGFGGFLDEAFRRHDFFLGRRNCQRFLSQHFTLPAESARGTWTGGNTLFGHWPNDLKEKHKVHAGAEPRELPIIPLVGTAEDPIDEPEWPAYGRERLDELRTLAGSRLKAVGNHFVDTMVGSALNGSILKFVLWRKRDAMLDWLLDRIERDLVEHQLLEPQSPPPTRERWAAPDASGP